MAVNESNCGRAPPRSKYQRHDHREHNNGQDSDSKHPNIFNADEPRTTQITGAVTNHGQKPKNRVNGWYNHGIWRKRAETLGLFKEQDRESSSNTEAAHDESTGSVLKNGTGTKRLEKQPVSISVCDQKPAKIAPKDQRKKKKRRHYKRGNVAKTDTDAAEAPEDWEKEMLEVQIKSWEQITFGIHPYGPEDVITFNLRNFCLKESKVSLWKVTSCQYVPAVCHKRPVECFRYIPFGEPGQFSDFEE